MKILAIFGAGGLGVETLELARIINEKEHTWDGFVFVNNGDEVPDIEGVCVCSVEKAVEKYGDALEGIIAVGEPTVRKKIVGDFEKYSIKGARIISPDVHIPTSTKIGEGVCICTGAYISCNVTIGDNVIISQHAIVGHDVVIDNNVIISATCVLCGMVHVKDNSYIGPGALVKESLTIGEGSVAAIGSVVFKDVKDGELVIGNPARASIRSGEKIFNG